MKKTYTKDELVTVITEAVGNESKSERSATIKHLQKWLKKAQKGDKYWYAGEAYQLAA